ncbi:polycystin-1-like protein 1 [Pteronotus mesoamericanus]|uniref:polycystin-1-like protein 1 n=1 Tax=Pteronotus mesoamericanus TaxID=1884717 RepID=UPI0023EB1D3F|nr:polycystic kidney disease protein 1-like 1 [Pteronotus parnellii mesoamericanus]
MSMNTRSVHGDQGLAFGSSPAGPRRTVATRWPSSTSAYNVSFASPTPGGGRPAWPDGTVRHRPLPISIYTNGTVFATDADVTFVAVTKETAPLEFTWFFGDAPPVRTTHRSIRRRLSVPGGYRVVVQASSGLGSVASEPRHVRAQRRVVANRLASASWALVGAAVAFECRISFGTDVAYLWDFGDGAGGLGNSSASHVYSREGEVTVQVLAFNDVSAACLSKRLFVVRRPCQPPPVRSPGPGKVQVWRSQPVTLGVAFDAAMLCDSARGLSYAWTFTNSAGSQVPLPPAVHTHGQTVTVPGCSLEPGNYTALAKVQVEGSAVHSNYCVQVEVRARPPVSVISEGTHLFVPRTPSSTVVLTGSLSYDPDWPGAALRYHWTCAPASAPGRPCFAGPGAHSLDARAPALAFAADSLSSSYDQFLVTLTVSSRGRNSSEAQVFLSTLPASALRLVHVSWAAFPGVPVNWNEQLSLRAACEGCGEAAVLTYSWDLFLVNATGRDREEVPFCRTVGLLGLLDFGDGLEPPESHPPSPGPGGAEPPATPAPSSRARWPRAPGRPDLSAVGRASTGPTVPVHHVPAAGDTVVPDGDPWDEGTPAPPPPPPPDLEAYYSDIQEAAPSKGRGTAHRTHPHPHPPGPGPSASADESRRDGDNLVGPLLPAWGARPALLVDWPKSPVSRAAFQSYTASGITGQTVTVKPYSLSPGATYVLQAAVASGHSFLGKAQLYLTVNPAPWGVACQVQPPRGLEVHTVFSVFCTSGRPDFHYEFSYRVGNASQRTLYRGTDAQHYFALPAGEPGDNYQVLVSTVITDGEGSRTLPCATAVTVLPRRHGDRCPGEDVYDSSLKSLSALRLTGRPADIRNYVSMTARALRRWARDGGPSCGLWSRMQDVLLSAVCASAAQDQEEVADSVLVMRDLLRLPSKLSSASAALILGYTRALLAPGQPSAGVLVDVGQVRELVLLVSAVLEGAGHHPQGDAALLLEEGIRVISDVLLGCLLAGCERQLHVSAGQMAFHAQLHRGPGRSVQSLGPARVLLPADLAGRGAPSPCYVSQLTLFWGRPAPWGRAPGQVGAVLALSLHRWPSGGPLSVQGLRTPVTVEFGEDDGPGHGGGDPAFVLLREAVNVHRFAGLSAAPGESLQIRIAFSPPAARAFPVAVLVRFSERPTPSDFLLKRTHTWEGLTAHVSVPAASLRGRTWGYLSLLDADYDRDPPNKYLAKAVRYGLRVQGIRCLLWDARRQAARSLSPQPGASPGKVSCSYDRPAAFSVARRDLNVTFETGDVSELRRRPENLLPSLVVVVFTALYTLLLIKSKRMDRREREKTGYIFLQENIPPGHQPYAVVVDTGFRAPARFTAKVYAVVYGANGCSGPRELYCPGKPLFERNSRHTFILSTPAPLGPLRRIRLWHDSCGASPAWYVSHVMVRELRAGPARGWFFPAECWLAAGRRDGRVERELACLRRGLGFRKLLHSTFTELLEDHHAWASVHSRPAARGLPHTPRLSVAFALLCAYACLAALVTAAGHEQLPPGAGPAGVPLGLFGTGFLCTLLASPGAQLLSLLFRLSQDARGPGRARLHRPLRAAPADDAAPGPDSQRRAPEARMLRKQSAPATLSGAARARNAASGDGAGRPPPDLEACGADLGQRALRERSDHCVLGSRAPGRLATSQRPRGPLPWPDSAAWAVCGTVSVACGLGTGFLGYRFSPAQCEQWLCLLAVSVTCCVFVTQPLMMGLVALGFAWKRRGDESFFTESLRKATEGLDADLDGLSRSHGPPTRLPLLRPCPSDPVLAARQQARRLRWARPPSMARLRVTRERMRRQVRTRAALRDTCLSALMLLLHLFIAHGASSRDERALSRAIRDAFTRGARSSLGGLSGVDAWWAWSLSTLLDGLYPGSGPAAASTPGTQLPRPLSALTEDRPPACCPDVGDPRAPSVTSADVPTAAPRAPEARSRGCELRLGRTRHAAHAALTGLQAHRWADSSTRALSVRFVLYSPPTRLLSSVSLSAEATPAGRLALSAWVESFPVFRSDSAPRFHLLLPQLALLALTLTHLGLQLHGLAEKGVHGYWRRPRNWLELPIAGAGLAWYAASGHLLSLAGEVADQVRRGFLPGPVDLSHMASWTQRARWLQGALSFLLTLRCLRPLGLQSAAVSRSLSGIFPPVVRPPFTNTSRKKPLAGVLLLAAHSHLRRISLFALAPPSGTFADAFHWLLFRFSQRDASPGSSKSDLQAASGCCVALLAAGTAVWFALLRSSLRAFTPKRKSPRSRYLVEPGDVAAEALERARFALGWQRPEPVEAGPAESHPCALGEFAALVDELLLRVDGLSGCLQPPPQELRDPPGAGAAEGPLVGASDDRATGPTAGTSQAQPRVNSLVKARSRGRCSEPPVPPGKDPLRRGGPGAEVTVSVDAGHHGASGDQMLPDKRELREKRRRPICPMGSSPSGPATLEGLGPQLPQQLAPQAGPSPGYMSLDELDDDLVQAQSKGVLLAMSSESVLIPEGARLGADLTAARMSASVHAAVSERADGGRVCRAPPPLRMRVLVMPMGMPGPAILRFMGAPHHVVPARGTDGIKRAPGALWDGPRHDPALGENSGAMRPGLDGERALDLGSSSLAAHSQSGGDGPTATRTLRDPGSRRRCGSHGQGQFLTLPR